MRELDSVRERFAKEADLPASTAGELVPGEYEALARVFHPPGLGPTTPDTSAPSPRLTWAQIALTNEKPFSAHAQWSAISSHEDPSPLTGRAPRVTWQHLAESVMELIPRSAQVSIACWEGWNGLEFGQRTPTMTWRGEPFGIARIPLRDVASVHQLPLPSISACWPQGSEWMIVTGIDFDSTIVAGNQALITHIVNHPDLEALPVEPGTLLARGPVKSIF